MEDEAPRVVTFSKAGVSAKDVIFFLVDNQNQRASDEASENALEISELLQRMTISSHECNSPLYFFSSDPMNLCHFCALK